MGKRKAMGHLCGDTALSNYHAFIVEILNEPNNLVYHYHVGVRDYYGVSGKVEGVNWLVIFGADAVLEPAFPPRNVADYLAKRGFALLGKVEELLHE